MKWTEDKVLLAKEIISAAPTWNEGYRRTAVKLGTTPDAVRVMKERNRFGSAKPHTTPLSNVDDLDRAALADRLEDKDKQIEVLKALRLRRTIPIPVKRAHKIKAKGRIHIVIGDTQVKPGVETAHLSWIGTYIAEQFAGQDVAIVHLGDHWDMPSLSSYDTGKKEIEGRRYVDDVRAGNDAFAILNAPITAVKGWKPEKHFLFGNHEDRITRACNDSAILEGALSLDELDTQDWQRHAFREVVNLDGIDYSHFFYNGMTGRPFGGENLLPRLKTIGRSFTMGHQQGLQYTLRAVGDRRHHGLVLGSTYLHEEKYLGPQCMAYWRGIVICHQVEGGQYDPMMVSLEYLCRRYEGKPLADFMDGLTK